MHKAQFFCVCNILSGVYVHVYDIGTTDCRWLSWFYSMHEQGQSICFECVPYCLVYTRMCTISVLP